MPLTSVLCLVALVAVGAGAVLWLPRRNPWPFWLRIVLVSLLAGSELVVLLWPIAIHQWSAATTLPLQLSDITTVVTVIALLLPRAWHWRELAYLWSIPAGLLGLTFPAIGAAAPSPLFYAFYVDHGTLLLVGILLGADATFRLGLIAVARVWAATVGWALVAAIGNLLTGGDYMFLRQPPSNWNPLMIMGPWPWYVVTAAAVAAVLFTLLALPKRSGGPATVATRLPSVPKALR